MDAILRDTIINDLMYANRDFCPDDDRTYGEYLACPYKEKGVCSKKNCKKYYKLVLDKYCG